MESAEYKLDILLAKQYKKKQAFKNKMSEEDEFMVDFLRTACDSCAELLRLAQESYSAAKEGNWERAADIIKSAQGYGFFDDGYHHQMLIQYIKNRKQYDVGTI